MSEILQFCSNLWIIFTNSFAVIKHFIFGFPYVSFAAIVVTAFFVFKMSTFETENIKDPYTKIGRKRI